jgi:hypothetical protein
MTVEPQRLLRTPKLRADESFMGYIIRLAEQNGYDSPAWILKLSQLNEQALTQACPFVYKSPESLWLLSHLSGNDISELASLTCRPVSNQLYEVSLFFGVPVQRLCILPGRPKVCPECLREAAYCRRAWEFVLITVCPLHRCLLIDECPNCKQRITWSRSNVTVCPCEYDWREFTAPLLQEHELRLTRTIYHLCGIYDLDTTSISRQNPVLSLQLQEFILAMVFISGQRQGRSLMTINHLLPKRRNKDFHKLFTEAYDIFENWPSNYYQFLHWWRKQQRNTILGYQRLHSVLYRDFGKFYMGLYNMLPPSQSGFIREGFLNYLVEEWEGCNLSAFAKGKDTGGYKVKYVSKSDAKRLLAADNKLINHFIYTGRLKTKVRSKGMKRLIFVDVADIAKLLNESS